MLTSKEIIERTGISRATLNNYIASGLVPRPQVLPPGPEHGAAPRIGYFPDDTVERIESIQRFKREGWSIHRIAEHLAANPPAAGAAATQAAPRPVAAASASAAGAASGRLWLRDVRHPAYIVDESFRIVWANDEARSSPLSPLPAGGATGSVFQRLLETPAGAGREAMLRFHVDVARQRAAAPGVFAGMPAADAAALEALLRDARVQDPRLVSHLHVPAAGAAPARLAYAVHLRDGVLFAFAPPPEGEQPAQPVRAAAPAVPRLTPVAVLVATLQDAHGLWVRLTAQEYFELLNEVWTELDRVFRRHHGVRGAQGGEVLVCYFLPGNGNGQGYLFNALAAAQQTRDAMRQVSRRWHKRKSWDIELTMNVGIDEGQEWMGGVGSAALGAVRVLGDAPDRAEQLSRSSRLGAILLTRSLVGKLPAEELQRVTYGVPAPEGSDARVLFTFARLEDIASPSTVPARFADLAVAELLDLKTTNPEPGAAGAG